MGRSLGDEETEAAPRPSKPLVAWQVTCDWRDDKNRTCAHVGPLFIDEREAWDAFHGECRIPHAGHQATVRLLRFERRAAGDLWGPSREIEQWTPTDPVGRWSELGRLRSDEQFERKDLAGLPAKVGHRPPEAS